MKLISVAMRWVVVWLCLWVGSASAHPGHDAAISEDEAVRLASVNVDRLVAAGKLDESWKLNVQLNTVERREYDGVFEYVVIYTNAKVKDQAKSTLYIFISDMGDYIAANFSGK